MRPLVLIAALAALAGCGGGRADVTCAELERSAKERREMTEAIAGATGAEPSTARATWETYCSNSTAPGRDRPYGESVRVLEQVDE